MSIWTRLFNNLSSAATTTKAVPMATSSRSIHDAAESGDLEAVKALVRANPDVVFSKDRNGLTPLHYVWPRTGWPSQSF